MLKNYFKIALRHLLRNKSYSIINILGLAIGMACFLVIALYVKGELGYDAHHEKADRIYRMVLDRIYPGRHTEYAIIPPSYAASVKSEFPEVEASTRLAKFPGGVLIKRGEEVFEEKERVWADSNFFSVFTIPFISGDPNEALKKPNAVVLTASTARKYFGNEDPMGKVLDIPQNDNDLVVTGVCEDIPETSHFTFDLMMSTNRLNFFKQINHVSFAAHTYLLLKENTDPKALEVKFPDLVTKYVSGEVQRNFGVSYEEYQKNGNGYIYTLQPLKDIYLHSKLEGELKPNGSMTTVYIFTIIAFFILFIACINFMNLATAKSSERAKEVGIRKTLGSERSDITLQFLFEAITISLISFVLAWGILQFMIPYFNELSGKTIAIRTLTNIPFLLGFIALALFVGLLAGIYPAFVLSGFKPLEVLKGSLFSTVKGAAMRNVLVVTQFVISVVLIIATIVVFRQLDFIQNKELGFDKENIINVQGGFALTAQQTETIKNQIRDMSGVAAVGSCNSAPGGTYFGVSFRPQGNNEKATGRGLIIDEDYVECMEMEIVEGRDYSKEFTDSNSVIINESAVRELGIVDPVGKRLYSDDFSQNGEAERAYTIVGVIKDFHFQSLHRNIEPLFLANHAVSQGVNALFSVRIKPNAAQSTIPQIEQLWKQHLPDQPFRYTFLDSDLAKLYQAEQTSKKVFGLFTMLAIFIACMGLLGLAAYVTQRRTKEIGIRKVIGASSLQIIGLLSKDFLKLVLVALLIAVPIAWYGMDKWLQNFAFSISLSWWMFALAGALAIGIAFLTVSFQSFKAAIANPINSLRDD